MRAFLPILLLSAFGTAVVAQEAHSDHEKIFIAPSGEPFRVSGDQPYPIAKWFAAADKNGDGKLDFAEFEADFMRFFNELDLNHDGAIDGVERTHYENAVAPETLGSSWTIESREVEQPESDSAFSDATPDATPAKPKYGTNPIGAARFDLLGMPEPVAAMDTELRGRISRSVAEQAARDRFNLLDESHRGYLTLDTLPPTFAQDHHHGGGRGKKGRHRR